MTKPFHTFLAHDPFPFRLEEGGEGDVQYVSAHLDLDRDLVRNHVEHPRAVPHIRGQRAEILDEEAAPYPLQIDRRTTERIACLNCQQLPEGRQRQQFEVVLQVAVNIEIHIAACDEILAVEHHDLIVEVVEPAEGIGGGALFRVAQRPDPSCLHPGGCRERRHIKKRGHVGTLAQLPGFGLDARQLLRRDRRGKGHPSQEIVAGALLRIEQRKRLAGALLHAGSDLHAGLRNIKFQCFHNEIRN